LFRIQIGQFIIGLTDVSPTVTAPATGNYAVCGQYPGAMADAAIVTLKCACNMPPYRYLIVQFPSTNEHGNLCELDVYIRRMFYQEFPHRPMFTRELLFSSPGDRLDRIDRLIISSDLTD